MNRGQALLSLVSLALVLSTLGCGERTPADSGADSGPPTTEKGIRDEDRKAASTRKGDLVLTLSADRALFRAGEPVRLKLSLANEGTEPVTLNWSSGQHFELTVEDAGGRDVYRWSRGRAFIQVLEERALLPGKEEALEATWDRLDFEGKPVGEGSFNVKGSSLAAQAPAEVGLSVRIGR